MEEIWKTITDYPDYMVSNYRQIYNSKRNRLLKINLDTRGYYKVNLSSEGVWKNLSVHRLVALEFVEGYFEGAIVNHKDGIKHNNYYENLEWCTLSDNSRHAYKNGLNPTRRIIWRDSVTGEIVIPYAKRKKEIK